MLKQTASGTYMYGIASAFCGCEEGGEVRWITSFNKALLPLWNQILPLDGLKSHNT